MNTNAHSYLYNFVTCHPSASFQHEKASNFDKSQTSSDVFSVNNQEISWIATGINLFLLGRMFYNVASQTNVHYMSRYTT